MSIEIDAYTTNGIVHIVSNPPNIFTAPPSRNTLITGTGGSVNYLPAIEKEFEKKYKIKLEDFVRVVLQDHPELLI